MKSLPLDVLIEILSSARPLHRVLALFLRRRRPAASQDGTITSIDPHDRVNTSRFLLQRTRRMAFALKALRERVERPAITLENLNWRLRGPVGVLAVAKALDKEAHSPEEKAFLISEMALELSRAKPTPSPGTIPVDRHAAEIRSAISDLRSMIPSESRDGFENLHQYVEAVFKKVGV